MVSYFPAVNALIDKRNKKVYEIMRMIAAGVTLLTIHVFSFWTTMPPGVKSARWKANLAKIPQSYPEYGILNIQYKPSSPTTNRYRQRRSTKTQRRSSRFLMNNSSPNYHSFWTSGSHISIPASKPWYGCKSNSPRRDMRSLAESKGTSKIMCGMIMHRVNWMLRYARDMTPTSFALLMLFISG